MFPTSIPSQWPLLWIPTCCNWDVNVMLRPALRRWLGTLRMAIHVPCHTCHASKIHDWQLDWDRRVFHDRGSIPYGMPVLRWQPCWCQKPIDAIDARGKIWWDDRSIKSVIHWTILDHIGPKDSKFDRGESDANGLGSTQVPRLQEGLLCWEFDEFVSGNMENSLELRIDWCGLPYVHFNVKTD